MLLAQEAVGGLVHGPRHVVLTPVVCVFAHFFLTLLAVLWRLFLPGIILLLFPSLLVLLLVPLVALFLSLICNSAELGSNLSSPLSVLRAAVIATIFSSSGDLAPQSPLVFSQSNLHFVDVMRAS